MHVNCSNCNSNYSLSNRELKGLNESILTCKKCKRYIKITICPKCKSFYSITFSTVEYAQYNFKCKRCLSSFVVDFSSVKDIGREEKNLSNNTVDREKSKTDMSSGNFLKKIIKPEIPDAGDDINKKNDTAVVFKNKILSTFNLKELFSITATAFSPVKMFISALGVISIILALYLFSGLESVISSSPLFKEYPQSRSFFNLLPMALVFYLFIMTSSVVSKNTMEKLFHDRSLGLAGSFAFILKITGPLFISNIFILILLNSLFILFGQIPVVGPVLFSFLFLPLYLVSFLILLVIILGFWFYPPIVAYRNTGVLANIQNFYHFIKKHNLTLLYIIPLLGIAASIIFGAVYFFHYSALSLAVLFSRGLPGESIGKVFSSIPAQMLRISEPSLFGADMGLFKSLMNGILFSHHIGGVVLGIGISLISIFLLGSFISITSTLSTHIYLMMERGVDVDDSRKIRLLILLVLILAAVFLSRAVFVRM